MVGVQALVYPAMVVATLLLRSVGIATIVLEVLLMLVVEAYFLVFALVVGKVGIR